MISSSTTSKFKGINITLLLFSFIAGLIVMYLINQPGPVYQGKTTQIATPAPPITFNVSGAIKEGASYYQIMKFLEQYDASHSAIQVINVPTTAPTPQVVYKTQYVPQYVQVPSSGSTTNCRSDYAGGMYCVSDSGVQTHCRTNYAGGMICEYK